MIPTLHLFIMATYGYILVSEEGDFHTFGAEIKYFCQEHLGCEPDGIYADELASRNQNLFERPAGTVLFDRLRPNDTLVAATPMHLYKRINDMATTNESLAERQILLHIISYDLKANDKLTSIVMNVVNQVIKLHLTTHIQLLKEGLQENISEGRPVNRYAPIGYKKVGKKFLPSYHDRGIAKQIVHWRDHDNLSWGECTRRLLFTKCEANGKCWARYSVRRGYDAAKNKFPLFARPDPFSVEQRMEQHQDFLGETNDDTEKDTDA